MSRTAVMAALAAMFATPAAAQEKYENKEYQVSFALPSEDYELKGYAKPQKGELWGWDASLAEIKSKDSAEAAFSGILLYYSSAMTAEKYADWRVKSWKEKNQNVAEKSRKPVEKKAGKWVLVEVYLEFQDTPYHYYHLIGQKGKHNLELMMWCGDALWDDSSKLMMKIIDSFTYGEAGASTEPKKDEPKKDEPKKDEPAGAGTPVPEDSWAGCGKDSWVKYKMTSSGMEMEMKHVLLEHEDGKSYTMRSDMTMMGNTTAGQPMKFVVKKPEAKGDDPKAEGDKPQVETGEETVKIAKGEYKCKWTKTTTKQGWSKVWSCDDVPFKMVKMESEASGMKTTMELVDFEKK